MRASRFEPRQFFYRTAEPWRPHRSPRADREKATRELFKHLCNLRRPPAPDCYKREMLFVGRILLGGTRALRTVSPQFKASHFKVQSLKILFQACEELASPVRPRSWFSRLALGPVIDQSGFGWTPGHAKRSGYLFLARLAMRMAINEHRRAGEVRDGA